MDKKVQYTALVLVSLVVSTLIVLTIIHFFNNFTKIDTSKYKDKMVQECVEQIGNTSYAYTSASAFANKYVVKKLSLEDSIEIVTRCAN